MTQSDSDSYTRKIFKEITLEEIIRMMWGLMSPDQRAALLQAKMTHPQYALLAETVRLHEEGAQIEDPQAEV